jgi:hypothetical protein
VYPTRGHPSDADLLLAGSGGVNPEPPIPLPDHNPACALQLAFTTGGIGRAAGLTPFGPAKEIDGRAG